MGTLGRRAFLAGLAASAALLAACDAVRFGETGGRIRLAASPGNQTLWRFLESRKDDLRQKGHLVDFFDVGDEDEMRTGFLNGNYDAIATLVPAVAQLADAGQAVKLFAPIAWLSEGYPLVVPDGSPIKAVGDIQGKRVATFPLEHPGFAYWRAFLLKHYGLRGEKVSTLPSLGPHEDLAAAKVDAAFVSGSGWAALRQIGGFRKVADLQGEFKWLTGGGRPAVFAGFIARSSWIDGHARFVADLSAATRQGLELYKKDRGAFFDVVTNVAGGIQVDRDENEAMAAYLGMDAATPDRAALSQADVEDFRKFFPLMADAGILKTPPRDAGALFKVAG